MSSPPYSEKTLSTVDVFRKIIDELSSSFQHCFRHLFTVHWRRHSVTHCEEGASVSCYGTGETGPGARVLCPPSAARFSPFGRDPPAAAFSAVRHVSGVCPWRPRTIRHPAPSWWRRRRRHLADGHHRSAGLMGRPGSRSASAATSARSMLSNPLRWRAKFQLRRL